jgi:2-desacetyl-2-hydroxyethyl bacteriochlorophyllide A dehydrogenase
MIYKGEAPQELPADATLSSLPGPLAFPLKYGYSSIGVVTALGAYVDPGLDKRQVFAFNPHETAFNANMADVQPLLKDAGVEDAAFLPNMETAVNLILDGEPRIGERVAVIGQGVVGLLTTALLAQHPLESLTTVEQHASRRKLSLELGAHASVDPAAKLAPDADLVYDLSGNPEALDLALNLVGDFGRVVVGSWYGQRRASLDLGTRFHRGRIKIISSQVSNIEPALRGRWDRQRRFAIAWRQLARVKPSRLITSRVPFAQAAEAYRQLADSPDTHLATMLTYE